MAACVVVLEGIQLSFGKNLNDLWCTDFNGQFLLGNHHYCYPLTVTDRAFMETYG